MRPTRIPQSGRVIEKMIKKIKRICEWCGKERDFYPSEIKRGRGRFCSRKCKDIAQKTQVKRICEQCGIIFPVHLSEIRRGNGKFCSPECNQKYHKGKNNSNWKGGKVKQICQQCGIEFPAHLSNIKNGRGKYCSPKCHQEAQKTQVKRVCKQCCIEFPVYRSDIKRGRGDFCSRKCHGKWLSEHQIGKNNPNWQGGISFEPYCSKFNEKFKEYIRDKFDRACFLCPKTEEDNRRRLDVHHVNYNKNCGCDNDETCQFVPLCISCNAKVNKNREMWEAKINAMLHNKLNGWYI